MDIYNFEKELEEIASKKKQLQELEVKRRTEKVKPSYMDTVNLMLNKNKIQSSLIFLLTGLIIKQNLLIDHQKNWLKFYSGGRYE